MPLTHIERAFPGELTDLQLHKLLVVEPNRHLTELGQVWNGVSQVGTRDCA